MYLVDLGSQNNDELLPKLFQAACLESGEEASRDSYWSSRCCWPTYSSSSKDSRRGGLFCSIFLALSDHIRSRFNCLKDSKSLSTCIRCRATVQVYSLKMRSEENQTSGGTIVDTMEVRENHGSHDRIGCNNSRSFGLKHSPYDSVIPHQATHKLYDVLKDVPGLMPTWLIENGIKSNNR